MPSRQAHDVSAKRNWLVTGTIDFMDRETVYLG